MIKQTNDEKRERMSKEKRRAQLTNIMLSLFERVEKQADFTIEKIADQAKVTEVHVYNHIGKSFSRLRAKLPGPRRSPDTEKHALRRELAETKAELKKLKAKYESEVEIDISVAIRTIEQLEARERQLLNSVEMLVYRLRRCGQKIELSDILKDNQISNLKEAGKERAA